LAAAERRSLTSRASLDSVSDWILAVCSSKAEFIRRIRNVVPAAKIAAIKTLHMIATRSGSENISDKRPHVDYVAFAEHSYAI
jgi:uracil phosphoribosyltransferase